MRDVMLKDWEWIAEIQYKNYQDTAFHVHSSRAVDILSAVAYVINHVKEHYPYEIISLRQVHIQPPHSP